MAEFFDPRTGVTWSNSGPQVEVVESQIHSPSPWVPVAIGFGRELLSIAFCIYLAVRLSRAWSETAGLFFQAKRLKIEKDAALVTETSRLKELDEKMSKVETHINIINNRLRG